MIIKDLVDKQRTFFHSGASKSIRFRIEALKTLSAGIKVFEKEISEALFLDLGKSAFEAYLTEIGIVISEISYMLKHLKRWSKPGRKKSSLLLFPARAYLYPEPYGVTLIMSPWNYPFQLAMMPLVAAIAAGNTAIVKPASYAKATSVMLKELLEYCFDEEFVAAVLGGREQNSELLNQKFDFIFFTGSTDVGKFVMQKASLNLTPVALELGGKSPCIVLPDADVKLAAKRIAFGKIVNAGQTCIAPDYVFVHKDIKETFLAQLEAAITAFLGQHPETNPDYPKIINQKHLTRLVELLAGQKIGFGGSIAEEKLSPTVLVDVKVEDKVMQEEIFGPILPVLAYDDLETVLDYIENRPKPLAMYLFTSKSKTATQILKRLSAGGVTINDTLMHYMSRSLGFGGVGESGLGRYHGKAGFDAFSNQKAVVRRFRAFDIDVRYHPYNDKKHKIIKAIIK